MRLASKARQYTFGEKIGNAVSHGCMAFITLGGIAPAAIQAYIRRGPLAAANTSIFMCSSLSATRASGCSY